MIKVLVVSSIMLGVLGIAMSAFSLYISWLNGKLEKKVKEQEIIINKKDEVIEAREHMIKEHEGFVQVLKEQNLIKERKISLLKRNQCQNKSSNSYVMKNMEQTT